MITVPPLNSFNPDEQKFIRDTFTSIARFEENLKKVSSIDFDSAFGESEGNRLWTMFLKSDMSLTEFGRKNFTREQGNAMVKHIKNMQ